MDPRKKKTYDSIDDNFDDSIPSSLSDVSKFYDVFAPVFARFSKWSQAFPVPQLGNAQTPWPEVEKFYKFWFRFRSW